LGLRSWRYWCARIASGVKMIAGQSDRLPFNELPRGQRRWDCNAELTAASQLW